MEDEGEVRQIAALQNLCPECRVDVQVGNAVSVAWCTEDAWKPGEWQNEKMKCSAGHSHTQTTPLKTPPRLQFF